MLLDFLFLQGPKTLFSQEHNFRKSCFRKNLRKEANLIEPKKKKKTSSMFPFFPFIVKMPSWSCCWQMNMSQTKSVKQRCVTQQPFKSIYSVIKTAIYLHQNNSHRAPLDKSLDILHKVTSASAWQLLDFSCGQLCFPPLFSQEQLIRLFQPSSSCNWWLRCAPQ